ncbi:MAG: hypothetical protein CMJ78_10515 [Planctomycetaceae bacterium]|nr:hypothetical protein [Planctomycetaceae bacterium]
MPIEFACEMCGEEYRVRDERAGAEFNCRSCGELIAVPDGDGDEWGGDYASATPKKRRSAGSSREEAASRLLLPAIFLYIIAGMSVINHGAGIVMALMGEPFNPFPMQQPGINPAQQEQFQMIGGVIGGIIGLVFDTLVIMGAYNMHKVKSFGMALTGGIIACIPCCGPCVVLAIPFGIWSLVVLNNADVKEAFR